ncbi:MAG: glycerophosphodiester phosphodiesterase family protein [Elusimicrobiales bacterium]|jgi:glycerophosphoryl diester phosphodiesterase|nr:glycerophosphodiester phosphodiesterase family protein [Elusimicrobiales bacterium]
MKIISHRGASGYAPENTLKAFDLAVKMGSRDFEFDVHRTRDGRLVVHHDYDLSHTAGSPARIAELDYAELSRLNAAAHFAADPAFQRVPLLEEVLDMVGPAADWINLEVKNDGGVYPGIEAEVLAALGSRPGLFEKSLVSSFDHDTLRRFRELSPELKLGWLGHGLNEILLAPAVLKARAVRAESFHLALRIAFRPNVALIKKAGFAVRVYTVNSKKDALRMKEAGADGVFSNYPDIMEEEA